MDLRDLGPVTVRQPAFEHGGNARIDEEDEMPERRRFFLQVPASYYDLSKEQQQAARIEMWRDALLQMGDDPDKLMSSATADGQDYGESGS